MVLYHPHTLVTFGGQLAKDLTALTTPVDIWSCSVRGGTSGGSKGPHSDPGDMLSHVQATLLPWFTGTGNGLSKLATLEWVKVNTILENGKYDPAEFTHQWDYPTPGRGTFPVTTPYPMFVTSVQTFLTNIPRGRASHGRISIPYGLASGQGGSSIQSAADMSAQADQTKALLSLLVTAGNYASSFVPRVYSSIDGSFSDIFKIRVGQRYDTINRRKNAIPEAPYQTVLFP